MAAPKKPNTKGGKSLNAAKDPYIKSAGPAPTKYNAQDCAMGDPNGKKSMALGGGGRTAKLKAAGVPGGVIGKIARSKGVFGHMDFKKGPGKGKKGS